MPVCSATSTNSGERRDSRRKRLMHKKHWSNWKPNLAKKSKTSMKCLRISDKACSHLRRILCNKLRLCHHRIHLFLKPAFSQCFTRFSTFLLLKRRVTPSFCQKKRSKKLSLTKTISSSSGKKWELTCQVVVASLAWEAVDPIISFRMFSTSALSLNWKKSMRRKWD